MLAVLQSKWFLPSTLLIYILLRALLVFLLPLEMGSDAGWYMSRALSIASGEGYSEIGLPTAFWPVGYPGMLGVLFYIFGKYQLVGQLANLGFAIGSFFLILALTRMLFRDEAAARLAVLLLAIYPNHIAYTPVLLTEIYFTFLVLLGSYLYLRHGSDWQRSIGSLLVVGLVFGLAVLTKPQALFFPGFLLVLDWWRDSGRDVRRAVLRRGLVIYLTMMAVFGPWMIRNTLTFGEPLLISNNLGLTLLSGNNPSADGSYSGDDPLLEEQGFTVADQVMSDHRARTAAMAWMSEHPMEFLALMPRKAWAMWAKDGEAEWEYQRGYGHYAGNEAWFQAMRILNQAYYLALLFGFAVSLYLMFRHRGRGVLPWSLLGYVLVLYLTAISTLFFGLPRFHFPAMPWVIMYAAWSASYVLKRGLPRLR